MLQMHNLGLYRLVWPLVLAGLFVAPEAQSQDIDHWETVIYEEDQWQYLVPVTEVLGR